MMLIHILRKRRNSFIIGAVSLHYFVITACTILYDNLCLETNSLISYFGLFSSEFMLQKRDDMRTQKVYVVCREALC